MARVEFQYGRRAEDIVEKLPPSAYGLYYFFFNDQILVWKLNRETQDVLGRLFLANVKDIGASSGTDIYITTPEEVFAIRLQDGAEMGNWLRILFFLREQAESKNRLTVFEK